LWHKGSDAELAADARASALVTHGHIRSQMCCAPYCLWARRLLEQSGDCWADAVHALQAILPAETPERQELDGIILGRDAGLRAGTGYVVDCLHSARWAAALGDYERSVKAAIALGHDTDTTACVAGGIAGLLDGFEGIPQRWLNVLREFETVKPMIDELITWRCG
jgi:ADP-ribosylglycohydrolase